MALSTGTPITIASPSKLDLYVVHNGVIDDDNNIVEQNSVGQQHQPGQLNQGLEVTWCEPVTGVDQQYGPDQLDQDHVVSWCETVTGSGQQHGLYRRRYEPEWFAFGVLPCGYEQQQQRQEGSDDDDEEEQHATDAHHVAPFNGVDDYNRQYDLEQSSRNKGKIAEYKLRQPESPPHFHYYIPKHCYEQFNGQSYQGRGKTPLYKLESQGLSFAESVAQQVNRYPDWPDYLGPRPGESTTSFFIRRHAERETERKRQRKEYIARLQASPFYGPSLVPSSLIDEDEDLTTEDAINIEWFEPENNVTITDWQRRSEDVCCGEDCYYCYGKYDILQKVRTVRRASNWGRGDTSHFYGRNRAEGRIWVNLVGHGSRGSRARR